MQKLNLGQRAIFFGGVGLAILMFLVPPMGHPATYGRIVGTHYVALFDTQGLVLDMPRLLIQYALLALLCWGLISVLKRPSE